MQFWEFCLYIVIKMGRIVGHKLRILIKITLFTFLQLPYLFFHTVTNMRGLENHVGGKNNFMCEL